MMDLKHVSVQLVANCFCLIVGVSVTTCCRQTLKAHFRLHKELKSETYKHEKTSFFRRCHNKIVSSCPDLKTPSQHIFIREKLKTVSLSEKGAVIVPEESCSWRGRKSTFLSLSVQFQFQSSHLAAQKELWYFWLPNQRHVQRFVYMCLFWWEYLYRDISESFLLGVSRCGCFHYKWIISENLKKKKKGTWDQIYPLLLWTCQEAQLKRKNLNLTKTGVTYDSNSLLFALWWVLLWPIQICKTFHWILNILWTWPQSHCAALPSPVFKVR